MTFAENQSSCYQLLRKMICCQLGVNCGFNSRTEQLRIKTEQELKMERKKIFSFFAGLTSKILPSLVLDLKNTAKFPKIDEILKCLRN